MTGEPDAFAARGCPPWCTVDHAAGDEDAAVHSSEPLGVTPCVEARLVAAEDADAPYVLLGNEERSLDATRTLGVALIELAEAGGRPAVPRTRLRDP